MRFGCAFRGEESEIGFCGQFENTEIASLGGVSLGGKHTEFEGWEYWIAAQGAEIQRRFSVWHDL